MLVAVESNIDHRVSATRGRDLLRDERNSWFLYQRWRRVLKQELADVWRDVLLRGGPYPIDPATLVERDILDAPFLSARRIAEALLVKQEQRWEQLLG